MHSFGRKKKSGHSGKATENLNYPSRLPFSYLHGHPTAQITHITPKQTSHAPRFLKMLSLISDIELVDGSSKPSPLSSYLS